MFILILFCGLIYQEPVQLLANTSRDDDQVSVDISLHDIKIDTLFHGQDISIYGAVDNYPVDIIISITGPYRDMLVLEKVKKFYLWTAGDHLILKKVPSFFAVLSNRDLNTIASKNTLTNLNLLVDNFVIKGSVQNQNSPQARYTQDQYRQIFLDVGEKREIIQYNDKGVKFLAGNMLFRADLMLPSYIVHGDYDVNIYIFKYGRLIGQKALNLPVTKSDAQYFVNNIAKNYTIIYSIFAILCIWLTSLFLHRAMRRIF